jgi:hypothetical protein
MYVTGCLEIELFIKMNFLTYNKKLNAHATIY